MIKLGLVDPKTEKSVAFIVGLTLSDLFRLAEGNQVVTIDGAADHRLGIGELKIYITAAETDDVLLHQVHCWAARIGKPVEVVDNRGAPHV